MGSVRFVKSSAFWNGNYHVYLEIAVFVTVCNVGKCLIISADLLFFTHIVTRALKNAYLFLSICAFII